MPKRTDKAEDTVKTSIKLARDLWKAAHVRAMDEGTDLQTVIAEALAAYLTGQSKKGGGR